MTCRRRPERKAKELLGAGQASAGTQGPSSSETQGVVAAGGQGTSAGGISAPPSVTSSMQGSEQMPLQSSGEGAGMGNGEGEGQELQQGMVTPPQGIQAPLGTPTASPGPAIGTAVPGMGRAREARSICSRSECEGLRV